MDINNSHKRRTQEEQDGLCKKTKTEGISFARLLELLCGVGLDQLFLSDQPLVRLAVCSSRIYTLLFDYVCKRVTWWAAMVPFFTRYRPQKIAVANGMMTSWHPETLPPCVRKVTFKGTWSIPQMKQLPLTVGKVCVGNIDWNPGDTEEKIQTCIGHVKSLTVMGGVNASKGQVPLPEGLETLRILGCPAVLTFHDSDQHEWNHFRVRLPQSLKELEVDEIRCNIPFPLPSNLKRLIIGHNVLIILPNTIPDGLEVLSLMTYGPLPKKLPAGLQQLHLPYKYFCKIPAGNFRVFYGTQEGSGYYTQEEKEIKQKKFLEFFNQLLKVTNRL